MLISQIPADTRLVAFDLDDTLAESKSPLEPEMGRLLAQLLSIVPVAVISGGQFSQFESQLLDGLEAASSAQQAAFGFGRLHLMPTCGTRYYRWQDAEWRQQYAEDLSPEARAEALAVLEQEARKLGLWEPARPDAIVWGDVLEDRGTQITFSALGQSAPNEAKRAWDPTGARKSSLRDAVAPLLPELEVRSGGSTSIDITRKGIDKAYGMRRLAELSGIPLEHTVFVGDRLDPDGNDYPVLSVGVRGVAVEGPADTLRVISEFLATR